MPKALDLSLFKSSSLAGTGEKLIWDITCPSCSCSRAAACTSELLTALSRSPLFSVKVLNLKGYQHQLPLYLALQVVKGLGRTTQAYLEWFPLFWTGIEMDSFHYFVFKWCHWYDPSVVCERKNQLFYRQGEMNTYTGKPSLLYSNFSFLVCPLKQLTLRKRYMPAAQQAIVISMCYSWNLPNSSSGRWRDFFFPTRSQFSHNFYSILNTDLAITFDCS